MSYILDALKKATADREHRQGNIPDLRAQHVQDQPRHTTSIGLRPRSKRLIAAALLLTTSLVAIFSWRMSLVQTLERVWPSSPPAADVVVITQPKKFSSSTPNAEMPTAAVMPPPLLSAPSKSADTAPAMTSNRTERTSLASAPLSALSTAFLATTTSQLSPLPDNAPKLVVSGSTYSDNAEHRLLIVNGHVFREGESPAAGIRIDKIELRTAVLQYNGKLFLLKY